MIFGFKEIDRIRNLGSKHSFADSPVETRSVTEYGTSNIEYYTGSHLGSWCVYMSSAIFMFTA